MHQEPPPRYKFVFSWYIQNAKSGLYLGFECNFVFCKCPILGVSWQSETASSCNWVALAARVQEKAKRCRALKVAKQLNLIQITTQFKTFLLQNFCQTYIYIYMSCRHRSDLSSVMITMFPVTEGDSSSKSNFSKNNIYL